MYTERSETSYDEIDDDSDDPAVILRKMVKPFVIVFTITIGIVGYLGAGQERNIGWTNIGCTTCSGFCFKRK